MITGDEVIRNFHKRDSLVNSFFLKWMDKQEGEPDYQGRVLDVDAEYLHVQYFSWLTGEGSDIGKVANMELDHYVFFDSTVEMKSKAKHSMKEVINRYGL